MASQPTTEGTGRSVVPWGRLNQHRQTGRGPLFGSLDLSVIASAPPLLLSDHIILDFREFLVHTSGLKPQSQMIRQNAQIASIILNKIGRPNTTGCRFCFYPSRADRSPQIPNSCNPLIAKFGQICFSWVCAVYFIGAGSDQSTNHCWREETESRQKRRRRRRTVTPQATSSLSPERRPQPRLISECFFIRARGARDELKLSIFCRGRREKKVEGWRMEKVQGK